MDSSIIVNIVETLATIYEQRSHLLGKLLKHDYGSFQVAVLAWPVLFKADTWRLYGTKLDSGFTTLTFVLRLRSAIL